jgi:hypothetical protein
MYWASNAFFLFFFAAFISTSTADAPECDTKYISGIPANVFSGVHTQFCNEVDKYHGHQAVSWTVNITGGKMSGILPRAEASLEDRSLSAGPIQAPLSLFTFDLAYNPTRKGVACTPSATCSETFKSLGSSCGHHGLGGNLMAYQGSHGSGCGIYSYYVAPPTGVISKRSCYPLNFFGSQHMKIQPQYLVNMIRNRICAPNRPRIKAEDNSTWVQNKLLWMNLVPYVFQVYWKEGCYQRRMDVDFNFPGMNHLQANCTGLLWKDYIDCRFQVPRKLYSLN